jgi:hypothetical protein
MPTTTQRHKGFAKSVEHETRAADAAAAVGHKQRLKLQNVYTKSQGNLGNIDMQAKIKAKKFRGKYSPAVEEQKSFDQWKRSKSRRAANVAKQQGKLKEETAVLEASIADHKNKKLVTRIGEGIVGGGASKGVATVAGAAAVAVPTYGAYSYAINSTKRPTERFKFGGVHNE